MHSQPGPPLCAPSTLTHTKVNPTYCNLNGLLSRQFMHLLTLSIYPKSGWFVVKKVRYLQILTANYPYSHIYSSSLQTIPTPIFTICCCKPSPLPYLQLLPANPPNSHIYSSSLQTLPTPIFTAPHCKPSQLPYLQLLAANRSMMAGSVNVYNSTISDWS